MKILIHKGDLLTSEHQVIIHGCNARGVMGRGIALAIRLNWPEVFYEYKKQFDKNGLKLGEIIPVTVKNKTVVNIITQDHYNNNGPDHVYLDYEGLRKGLYSLKEYLDKHKYTSFGMPLIGAGLANGKWPLIEKIINEVFEDTSITPNLYVLDYSVITDSF